MPEESKNDLPDGQENESYHTIIKSSADFSFFYDHHVPKELLPEEEATDNMD